MRAALFLFVPLAIVGCGAGETSYSAESASARSTSASAKAVVSAASAAPQADAYDREGAGESVKGRLASVETPTEVPRLVVRNAQLGLRVASVEEGERRVGDVARVLRGSVEGSQGSDLASAPPSMSVTLRVPETRFDEALRLLERLGTRTSKNVSSEDVSAQEVDLDARLKSLRVQEGAYRAILSGARRIPDVLEIQEKLTGVRTGIERIVAQRRGLGDQAARSTIVVELTQIAGPAKATPVPVEPNWLATTWSDATGSLFGIGRGIASLLLWLVAMSPIWAPLSAVALYVRRKVRRDLASNAGKGVHPAVPPVARG